MGLKPGDMILLIKVKQGVCFLPLKMGENHAHSLAMDRRVRRRVNRALGHGLDYVEALVEAWVGGKSVERVVDGQRLRFRPWKGGVMVLDDVGGRHGYYGPEEITLLEKVLKTLKELGDAEKEEDRGEAEVTVYETWFQLLRNQLRNHHTFVW